MQSTKKKTQTNSENSGTPSLLSAGMFLHLSHTQNVSLFFMSKLQVRVMYLMVRLLSQFFLHELFETWLYSLNSL